MNHDNCYTRNWGAENTIKVPNDLYWGWGINNTDSFHTAEGWKEILADKWNVGHTRPILGIFWGDTITAAQVPGFKKTATFFDVPASGVGHLQIADWIAMKRMVTCILLAFAVVPAGCASRDDSRVGNRSVRSDRATLSWDSPRLVGLEKEWNQLYESSRGRRIGEGEGLVEDTQWPSREAPVQC